MSIVKFTAAAVQLTVRSFSFIIKKIQHMRSPPAAASRSTTRPIPASSLTRRSVVTSSPITGRTIRPTTNTVAKKAPIGPALRSAQPVLGQWVPQGSAIVVQGIAIAGGLLYVGSSLKTAAGKDEPCLINPNQTIAFRSVSVKLEDYWPTYASITPQARRTYLEWLSSGCKDPAVDIGYVFLYFYGLERRAVFDAALDSAVMRDYPILATEITRLLSIYGSRSKSFKKYANQLLDWVTFTNEQKIYASNNLHKVAGSLMKIKFALGQAAVDSAPIPARLMLAWVKEDSANFTLRTPATRCSTQFDSVFETQYREKFGSGVVVVPNRTRLKFIYTPASPGFSNTADIAMSFKDIPDIAVVAKMKTVIQTIVEEATQAIEPFSRYLARKPQGHDELEGLVLLPPYLWPTQLRQTLHSFKRSVLKAPVVMNFLDLMNALGADTTLSKDKSKALAQSLSALGIGMEPDVMLIQKSPRPEETVVLFDLPTSPDPTRDNANYKVCFIAVQLASAVAASDGEFSGQELSHLDTQLQTWTHLPVNHCKRLAAQLHIRRVNPIKLHVLTKQLEALGSDTKKSIMVFMEMLAQQDKQATAKEVQFMEKVYKALGLDATQYISENSAILAADKISKAARTRAGPINTLLNTPKKAFYLDPNKIAALHGETEKVSAFLEGIFSPESNESESLTVSTNTIMPDIVARPLVQLSPERLAALHQNTTIVESVLAEIFLEDVDTVDVALEVAPDNTNSANETSVIANDETETHVFAPCLPGLDAPHDAFARFLLTRHQWSRDELQDVTNDLELMLDGALERLNDAAFDAYDAPFTEGDDAIEINPDIKEKLLS